MLLQQSKHANFDFQTIEEDDTVTVRNRDTMNQERVVVSELAHYVLKFMRG